MTVTKENEGHRGSMEGLGKIWVGLRASWEGLGASWEGFGASWEGLRASWEGVGDGEREKKENSRNSVTW